MRFVVVYISVESVCDNKKSGNYLEIKELVCTFAVSNNSLAIQVSFLRGQAVYVTTHLKSHLWAAFLFFLFTKTIHHHFQKTFAGGDVALNGNFFISKENQDFDSSL